jgi:hypothetical protein
MFSTQAFAVSFFEYRINDQWEVFGTRPDENDTQPAACSLKGTFADGSVFQFTKRLDNGVVYIWIKNVDWYLEKGRDDKLGNPYQFLQGDEKI